MTRPHFAVALLLVSIPSWSQANQPDFRIAQDEAATFLGDLVRIDTSNPPGNESQAASYIKRIFQKEGIGAEIVEEVAGRGSVIAHLKGNGSKKPLLLMGHTDVVPVDRAYWTFDPFGGNVKNGILFGRGALDDKGLVAANMEVLLLLHRLKIPLARDVIFLAEASEEAPSAA